MYCRSHRRRTQTRRQKTEDQRILSEPAAEETPGKDVTEDDTKIKEEHKRTMDTEEHSKPSKVTILELDQGKLLARQHEEGTSKERNGILFTYLDEYSSTVLKVIQENSSLIDWYPNHKFEYSLLPSLNFTGTNGKPLKTYSRSSKSKSDKKKKRVETDTIAAISTDGTEPTEPSKAESSQADSPSASASMQSDSFTAEDEFKPRAKATMMYVLPKSKKVVFDKEHMSCQQAFEQFATRNKLPMWKESEMSNDGVTMEEEASDHESVDVSFETTEVQ
eukprot:g42940.t1